MKYRLNWAAIFLLPLLFVLLPKNASSQTPVIKAVLFYSPTCPHCHEVMEIILPPLVQQYPNQLDIVGVDVSHPVGLNLYQAATSEFKVADDRLGVPTMIVGTQVLVGADEIEILFPNIITSGIAAGGVDWPRIPGLDQILAAQSDPTTQISSAAPTGQEPQTDENIPDFVKKFFQDPLANSIALVVLLGMILSCMVVLISYLRGADSKFIMFPDWVLPILAILGLGVASYLSYVEISSASAVCGPVGNCNSVQESPYAHLFGIIPVGIMGTVGYVAILISWLLRNYGTEKLRDFFSIAIWGMAWFGVLFSIYLTFLEPFVIGATCAWCIFSAIVITLILIAATAPAKEALRIKYDDEDANLSPEIEMSEESS